MKANYKESNPGDGDAISPSAIAGANAGANASETAQLRAALDHANQRIHELEESMSNLRVELEHKQASGRCKPDFSWLAMA